MADEGLQSAGLTSFAEQLLCIHAVEPESDPLCDSINPLGELGLFLIVDEAVPPKHPTRFEPPSAGIMADGPGELMIRRSSWGAFFRCTSTAVRHWRRFS